MDRFRPVAAPAGFSTWQPDMLTRMAKIGQEQILTTHTYQPIIYLHETKLLRRSRTMGT